MTTLTVNVTSGGFKTALLLKTIPKVVLGDRRLIVTANGDEIELSTSGTAASSPPLSLDPDPTAAQRVQSEKTLRLVTIEKTLTLESDAENIRIGGFSAEHYRNDSQPETKYERIQAACIDQTDSRMGSRRSPTRPP